MLNTPIIDTKLIDTNIFVNKERFIKKVSSRWSILHVSSLNDFRWLYLWHAANKLSISFQQPNISGHTCINILKADKISSSASEDAVDNRGEDLRFPISSSSGFSSPMYGALERGLRFFWLTPFPFVYIGFVLLQIPYLNKLVDQLLTNFLSCGKKEP